MKAIKKPSRKAATRPPPEPERDEHPILHFFGVLRSAYASPASDVSEQRKKLMAALSATADLIDLTDFGGENPGTQSAAELRALVVALEDLERGVQSPLLKPSNMKGRKADAANIWMIRANVVIAAEFFSAEGLNANEVARLFSTKYRSLNNLLRPNTDLKACIKGWRNALTKTSEALNSVKGVGSFPAPVANHFKSGMAIAHSLRNDQKRSKAIGVSIVRTAETMARALSS